MAYGVLRGALKGVSGRLPAGKFFYKKSIDTKTQSRIHFFLCVCGYSARALARTGNSVLTQKFNRERER